MKISSRTRYTITLQRNRKYSITAPGGKEHFIKTDTQPGQKLYLVGLAGKLHYVGITNCPMSARILMGLKAKGKNGYHGYAWKNIRKPMTLDVITWRGGRTIRKDVEAIEAEVAFLCRSKTGKWPLSQTEIHFRPPNAAHKRLAKDVYKHFKHR